MHYQLIWKMGYVNYDIIKNEINQMFLNWLCELAPVLFYELTIQGSTIAQY